MNNFKYIIRCLVILCILSFTSIVKPAETTVTILGNKAGNVLAVCEAITIPFAKDGIADECYTANGTIEYINSWNMDYVEVNGKDFTNTWASGNDIPASSDGMIHITYQASVPWAHFEIKGENGSQPDLSVNPNSLSFGEVVSGSSSILNYTLTGSNLSGKVTINAPSPFTVSTTSGGAYNSSITLAPSGGTISQAIYVKFAPSAIQGYSGKITNTAEGASIQNVTVSGSGVETIPPTLAVNPASIGFGSVIIGSSQMLNYTLTGSNLVPSNGNISISSPSGFGVSAASGSGFSSSISVPYTNGSVSKAIYVRFAPSAEKAYAGNVSNSGGGASMQNVSVSGKGVLVTNDRHRVIVSTDIGGSDNDDFQSMVHFLVYADVMDVEGLVSSPWQNGRKRHILEAIEKYETDYPKLVTYSANYPTPDALRAITKQGATAITPSPGYSKSTEGSNWIVECARRPDPRPLYILVWGCLDDVPQALHDAPDIESKLRVYWIGGPNKKYSTAVYAYLKSNFPNLWIIEANTTYRGMFNGGNQSGDLSNNSFVSTHVRNHGALGNYFYDKRSSLKAGDTPSVLYVLNNNVDDPSQPGWGGAFVRMSGHSNWWTDNPDPAYREGSYNGAKTVNIWREEFLRDFQARMDRCQAPKSSSVKRATHTEKVSRAASSLEVKHLYPNPVNSLLNIEFNKVPDELVTIYLLDIAGKPVKTIQTTDINHYLDISDLSAGLYLVRISGLNINIVKTIAKE